MRAVSKKFAIYKTAGIYSIVFEYIYFSEVTLLELYTNPTKNIRKLCGLEPIGIQLHRKGIELLCRIEKGHLFQGIQL